MADRKQGAGLSSESSAAGHKANCIKLFLLNPFKFCQLNSVCDLRKCTPRVHCGMNKLIACFSIFGFFIFGFFNFICYRYWGYTYKKPQKKL